MNDREIVLRLAFCQILQMPTLYVKHLSTSEMLASAKKTLARYANLRTELNETSKESLNNMTAWVIEAQDAGIV